MQIKMRLNMLSKTRNMVSSMVSTHHKYFSPPLTPSPTPTPLDKKRAPSPLLLQFSVTEVPIPWFIELQLVWMKRSAKYNLLGICEILQNSTNLDCHMWFQWGIIGFDYSNFPIHNNHFFSSYEIAVGKNVRQQLK